MADEDLIGIFSEKKPGIFIEMFHFSLEKEIAFWARKESTTRLRIETIQESKKDVTKAMVEGSVKKISFPKYRLAQKKRKVLLRFVPGISEKEIDWVKFPTLFFLCC